MSLSYDFIALLAVLSASQVASIQHPFNSVVIDAQGNVEGHLKHRMTPKTEDSVHVVIDAQGNTAGQSEALLQTNEEEAVLTLQIDGMMCGKCAGNVEWALSRVPGVRGARVSHITQKGQVQFDPSIASKDAMIGAVQGIGFGASLWQEGEKPEALLELDGVSDVEVAMLRIDGMKSEMCSSRVESALSALPGVHGASVSPTTRVGQVQFHPSLVSTDALVDAVKGIGFGASLLQEKEEPEALLQLNGEEAVVMLQIDGMMCDKCATNVERALSRVPGVHAARVSHTTHKGEGQVHFHPSVASTEAIVDAVKDIGFGASLLQVP